MTEADLIKIARLRFCRTLIGYIAHMRRTNLIPLSALCDATGWCLSDIREMFPADCYGDSLKVSPANSTP